jgi:hypothetical protein
MNIPDVHIERIRGLGYTESEARFLYIVAVFSGYFTLGQFRAFTGASYGKRPTCFAEKLIEQGHARICGRARGGSLFHLFSRAIYGQMEKDNLRNRKRHSLGLCVQGWFFSTSFWATRTWPTSKRSKKK